MTMQVGDRIELVQMPEDPDPIPPGTQGTVTNIVDTSFFEPGSTQVWVDWDNGRGLSLQIPPDRVRVIREEG
jgi:hypothetical protein